MNLFRSSVAAASLLLRVIFWMILAISVYFTMLWLALELRVIVFDNLCTRELRHDFENEGVDWCETWWWHPLRLSTRLISGALAAWIAMTAAWVMMPRKCWGLVIAALFLMGIAALHTYYFSLVALMKDITSTGCLHGWYSEYRTAQHCSQLLGPFGDLRFYYPATVALLSLVMALLQRKRIDSRRNNICVQQE